MGDVPSGFGRAAGLAVRREQIADVGARIADCAHLPVEHGEDPGRVVAADHGVPEPEVPVDDGRRERIGHVVGEPRRDLVDAWDLTRLVDVPELREAPYLPLVVASRTRERGEARRRDVGRVDLDERLDEIVAERSTRSLGLETRRQLVGRNEPVQVRHDVEGDAEQALVLADRGDRRQPREAGLTQCELQPRLADDVVRGRRQRRSWRTAQDERARLAFEEKREVRATALPDAPRPHIPRAEPVLVEKPADPVEHDERWLRRARRPPLRSRRCRPPAPCDPTPMRRRLYLMRHAEVSYFAEDGSPVDPRDVPLNEEGIAQAKSGRRGARRDRARPRALQRPSAHARDRVHRRARHRAGVLARAPRDPGRPALGDPGGRAPARVRPRVPRRDPERDAVPPRRVDRRALRPGRPRRRAPRRRRRLGHRARRPPRRRQPGDPLVRAHRREDVPRPLRAGTRLRQRARPRRRWRVDRARRERRAVRPPPRLASLHDDGALLGAVPGAERSRGRFAGPYHQSHAGRSL